MFPYRGKYTESEYDIQNNDLSYKIPKTCQNIFEHFENVRKNQKTKLSKFYSIISINCIIHIL